jgi:hypothetical protein
MNPNVISNTRSVDYDYEQDYDYDVPWDIQPRNLSLENQQLAADSNTWSEVRKGDVNWSTRAEVESLMGGSAAGRVVR